MLIKKKIRSPRALINAPTSITLMNIPSMITAIRSIPELLTSSSSSSSSDPVAASITGFVQNRRRYENDVSILILVPTLHDISSNPSDGLMKTNSNRLECILHPSVFDKSGIYGNLLTVNSGVTFIGFFVTDPESGKSTLWVKHASLTRASWRPNTLRYILDLLNQDKVTVEEVSQSLLISIGEAEELSKVEDLTIRQWQANQISVKLQSLESNTEKDIAPELTNVLHQYKRMRDKWPVTAVTFSPMEEQVSNSLSHGSPGSRWQRKKKPQLEWMLQQIGEIINCHEAFGKRTIHILDVGGGQGKLANYLARCYGDQIQVHVIDISRGAVKNGAMRAKRMNLSVQYQVNDASKTLFQEQPMDVVVALHACGHLSDVALAHAVQQKAGIVICPCCFLSNPNLRIPGSQETVEHFLQIPKADWWAMKYLAEIQGDFFLSNQAIHTLCAVRADAISQLHTECTVTLKSFPIQYSTRNLCLVGKPNSQC
jgi:2-polyprenyl-3-methyl-5-hydroxy-6-metoxy-1,4-benzoquinol methylase